MRSAQTIFAATLFLSSAPLAPAQWRTLHTGKPDSNLRAVSATYFTDDEGVSRPAIWFGGSNGVIFRCTEEGRTCANMHVPDGDALDFRGIAAFDAAFAYAMSVGPGAKSRIYKTTDTEGTWQLQFIGSRKEAFLDAMVCLSKTHCFVLGDPVDGKFLLLSTEDGEHWKELPRDKMPAALPSEGAFAASNSSLCIDGGNIYFGTGGAAKARIFHSDDFGLTWTVTDTPIAAGNASSGIFSLDCKAGRVLLAGGDYKDPSRAFDSVAYLPESGGTWQLSEQPPGGFRSGLVNVGGGTVIAVGPSGEDISRDLGVTWQHSDSLNLNAVTFLDINNIWAVGPNGTIARFVNQKKHLVRNGPTAIDSDARRTYRLPDIQSLSTLPGPLLSDSFSNLLARNSNAGRQHGMHLN
ncbi:MAG TPA: hypothetical protein VE077_20825 [Candidatus Methylomirabilis sp.]|nr:hypothetical protein [Candidatus Methylomirabilis sp.]